MKNILYISLSIFFVGMQGVFSQRVHQACFDSAGFTWSFPTNLPGYFMSVQTGESTLLGSQPDNVPLSLPTSWPENTITFPGFGVIDVPSPDRSVGEGVGSEISVCVDPNNKESVAEINMSHKGGPIIFHYSYDKGRTWDEMVLGDNQNLGDPTSLYTTDGKWAISYLRLNEDYTETRSILTSTFQPDLGDWELDVDYGPIPFLDKPHYAIGKYEDFEQKYLVWRENLDQQNAGIMIKVDDESPECISEMNVFSPYSMHNGANIQIGPEGEVYITWTISSYQTLNGGLKDELRMEFARSLNGGVNFGPGNGIGTQIREIHGVAGLYEHVTYSNFVQNTNLNSFPSMCVDKSRGPHNGRIYIVFAETVDEVAYSDFVPQIRLIFSDDKGDTWFPAPGSPPITVNDLNSSATEYCLFPWISCDSETGVLSIIYYKNILETQTVRPYVAMSRDFGLSWENSPVGDYQFSGVMPPNTNGLFFGDYIGIASLNSIVYPLFTDNHTNDDFPRVYASPFYAWNCVSTYPNASDPFSIESTITPNHIREWEVSEANGTITSRNIVENSAVGVYNAGLEISFNPDSPSQHGFWAKAGSFVHAYIDGCDMTLTNPSVKEDSKFLLAPKIDTYVDQGIRVYPNPCHDHLQIEFPGQSDSPFYVVILDLAGQAIYQDLANGGKQYSINMDRYPKGLYILKVFNDRMFVSKKVVSY